MHDIWNPWHGCRKYSEGCQNCYMYYLDAMRGKHGSDIYKVKTKFNYPIQKERDGSFKIKSGEMLRVCMTSDFFLKEADPWRQEAWDMISWRRDVIFFLLTKRADRIMECLPDDWEDGYENVFLNVACENQKRAEERLKILREIPAKHKGVMVTPMLGEVDLSSFLKEGWIEQVVCGGENYGGERECRFEWVQFLSKQCQEADVRFVFIETGTRFVKEGKVYRMPNKGLQAIMAHRANVNVEGKPIVWRLFDPLGLEIPKSDLYVPSFREHCFSCGNRMICNGCSNCRVCTSSVRAQVEKMKG